MQYALQIPEGTKFDFQNIDVKLYLACVALLKPWGEKQAQNHIAAEQQAILALAEFELSHGPLPDWAVGRNWDYSLVPGAQLCTKDGRKTGNAHVLRVDERCLNSGKSYFDCITDAGSYIHDLTEQELLEQFWVGDWISDPKTLIARFGNHGEDYGNVPVPA